MIINSQMSTNSKMDKSYDSDPAKGKNLILVSNNSDIFGEIPFGLLISRNSSHGAPDFRRSSSIGNLFAGFQKESAFKEEPKAEEVMTDAQRYAQECLEYEKYQFDDKIRLIIHRMAILAYHSFREKTDHLFLTFFIERFLCTLAKKLLLNRFELLFLEYVFEECKWRYDIDMISACVDDFKSFMHIPEAENPHGMIKNLQIYLLFCAYYSKRSLNDITQEGIYNHFLKTISERFKERYQEWTDLSGVTKIKINPKMLNLIFKKLTSFNDKEKDFFENYNLLVEEILEISPAYNADKEGKVRRKKKKVEEE